MRTFLSERKRLKGQEMPESIGMTLIFLLILVGLVMIGFLVYIKLNFNLISGEPIAYSVNFVSIASKPFLLAEVLTHMNVVDRQVLEHSIQAVATGSLERANSEILPAGLRILLQPYKFKYYRVAIETKDDTLMEVENIVTKCGEDDKGWCTDSRIGCDVGYTAIDAKGKCGILGDSGFSQCCAYNPNEYRNKGNSRKNNPPYDIIRCGNNRGVCSEGEIFEGSTPTQCGEGQLSLGKTDECREVNNGKTPFCCSERTDELEVETGVATQAIIPLLYKDKAGRMEVEARSSP